MKKYYRRAKTFINSLDPYGFFRSGELRLLATSLSFTSILALIPFLAVVLATFQFVGGLDFLYPKVEAILLEYMKEATSINVGNFLRRSLQRINTGALGSTGIFFLIGTSYALLRDIEIAFNRIWQVRASTRSFHHRLLIYWLVFLMAPVLLAILAGLKSFQYTQAFGSQFDDSLISGFFLIWGLWMMYKIIPATYVRPRYAFYASLIATGIITLIQQTLAGVIMSFFRYNKIYGSLAALPIVLFWILFMWYAVLFGSYICYFLQNRHRPESLDNPVDKKF